ncbi:MAG: hypothetical protein AUJ98_03905 [Bacteroidetes bacterium CG2_30_33_31]|nr:MAG: hypothetical protein AUJ98_03905 [Bacteroidetes bacterium CG2_30_33_31]
MSFCYKYPRPAVTVDALVFSTDKKVLLIKRKNPPFEGLWALPGGFLNIDETLESAVARELFEETGIKNIDLKQFKTFGDINRDPRHRTLTVTFIGIINNSNDYLPTANDDASESNWFDFEDLPNLAFDHSKIIMEAILKIRI